MIYFVIIIDPKQNIIYGDNIRNAAIFIQNTTFLFNSNGYILYIGNYSQNVNVRIINSLFQENDCCHSVYFGSIDINITM